MTYLDRALPKVFAWLLISPAVLPVVLWSGLIYPYLVPKTLLFYTLSLLSAAIFLLLIAYGRPFYFGRLRERVTWIPLALVALAYLASALGIDFYRSFWSLFVRGDGLLLLTCIVIDFYLILLYADRAFFDRFVRTVALVGTFVALYGIGEWLFGGGRVGSLLGNAAFFAGYLGVALFATLAATRSLSGAWRRAVYAGAMFQFIAIVLSATRGTILALGVSTVVSLIYLTWRGRGYARTWSVGALGTLIVLGGLFLALRSEIAKVPFEPIARIASISTSEGDVASRIFIWRHMLGEIGKAPILGVGAEHIDVLFNRFYDPTQIREEWFDRAHNAFLDYAAQYGLGGLVLYLALIASFFAVAWRLRRGNQALAGIAALLAITYAVQNFFVFDTVSSLWLFLALLAVFLALSSEPVPARALTLSPPARFASWGVAAALILLIIPISVRGAMAAYDLAHAYAWAIVAPANSVAYLERGFALGSYGDVEYGYEAYDMYVNHQHDALSGDRLAAAYQEAETILERNFNRYRYDARTALYFAHVLSLAPANITADKNLIADALAIAIKESPKRSQSWYVLVNLSITEANTHPSGSSERAAGYAAAKDLLSRYIALVPTLSEPHFVLAELARAEGDSRTAASEAALGKQYYKGDLSTAKRAAGYFENVSDWADARFFLNEVVTLDPTDNASRYDLAKVTYLAGDPAAADDIVNELRVSAPDVLQSDPAFMSAITAYERSLK
ncbi:MAG: O-antigen ligase family protein [bacterium]|nr:O-antigen ligase family protein [bacterium]